MSIKTIREPYGVWKGLAAGATEASSNGQGFLGLEVQTLYTTTAKFKESFYYLKTLFNL